MTVATEAEQATKTNEANQVLTSTVKRYSSSKRSTNEEMLKSQHECNVQYHEGSSSEKSDD